MNHDGPVTPPTDSASEPKRRTSKKSTTLDPEALRAKLMDGTADFPATMRAAIEEMRAVGTAAVEANQDSLHGLDQHIERTLAAIERELDKPDHTSEVRLQLIDRMVELAKYRAAKDTENKGFLASLTQDHMKGVLLFGGGVVLVTLTAVAGPEGVKQIAKALPSVTRRAIST